MSTDPTGATEPAAGDAPAPPGLREPQVIAKQNRAAGLALGATVAIGFLAGLAGAAIIALGSTLVGPGATLGERLSAVEANLGAAASKRDMDNLDKRAAALEQRADGLHGTLTGLGQRVETTQSTVAQLSEQAKAALEQAKSVAAQAAGATGNAPTAGAAAESAALGQRLDEATRQVSAVDQRLAAFEQRLSALAQAPKGLTADDLATTVAGLQDKIGQANRPALGSAWIGIALLARDKLNAGLALGPEIAALQSLGATAAALAPLQPFADTPAPSMAALGETFASSIRAILAAHKPAEDGNLLDWLSAEAAQLVRVRKLGESKGSTPADLVARIETALAQDRLADAMAAWNTLPEASRAASKAFGDAAQARLGASQALDRLIAASLDAMVSGNPGAGEPSR
jgi:hypothetical protein